MRFLSIILLVYLSSSAEAKNKGKEILEKAMAEMKSHKSLSYTATLRMKYAQTNDTTTHSSVVHMIRDERDKLMGGMIWQSDSTTPSHYSFYDMDMRYIVMHPQRKVWREKMPDPAYMGLRTSMEDLLFKTFLKPGDLPKEHFEKIELLNEATIDGQSCYVVKTRQTSGFDNIGPIYHTWYFSRKDMFPLLDIYEVKIDDGIQYSERRFVTHEYDSVTTEQFSPKQIPADYKVDARQGDNRVIKANGGK